ncbi:MAG: sulfotransferase [Phycisphaerales bacterium]|nr:sulfotransferase [Phycisphaerales bacterium]
MSTLNSGQLELRSALEMAMGAHRAGNFAQAEGFYRQILSQQPNQPDALHGLSLIGLAAGDPMGALQFAERAAALVPNAAQPTLTLGRIYRTLGWQDEAVAVLKKAVQRFPAGTGELHMFLGQAQLDARDAEGALATFGIATAMRPDDIAAAAARAIALHRLGRSQEAIDIARAAMKASTQPGQPEPLPLAVAFLGAASETGVEAEAIEIVERACSQEPLPHPALAEFALKNAARLLEKQGDIERAWAMIDRANKTRPVQWDAAQTEKAIGDKIAAYAPERLPGIAKTKVSAEQLVFVVGMPRSGTTLVEQIIHAHPKAKGCGELADIWWRTVQLQTMLGDRSFGPNFVDKLTPRTLEISANEHMRRMRKRAAGAERIVDKMPSNYFNLGLIWQLFPSARVIHCTRDPLDTCFSIYATPFSADFPQRRDSQALAHEYGQYRRLMDGWSHMFDGRLIEVNYEALVHNQEAESRKIMEFLELPWDDACLRYWEAARIVRTASEEQVRKPIYTSSIGRAKAFEAHLGSLIEGLRPWTSAN